MGCFDRDLDWGLDCDRCFDSDRFNNRERERGVRDRFVWDTECLDADLDLFSGDTDRFAGEDRERFTGDSDRLASDRERFTGEGDGFAGDLEGDRTGVGVRLGGDGDLLFDRDCRTERDRLVDRDRLFDRDRFIDRDLFGLCPLFFLVSSALSLAIFSCSSVLLSRRPVLANCVFACSFMLTSYSLLFTSNAFLNLLFDFLSSSCFRSLARRSRTSVVSFKFFDSKCFFV